MLSKKSMYVNDRLCNLNFSVSEQFLSLSHIFNCILADLAWKFHLQSYFFIAGVADGVWGGKLY